MGHDIIGVVINPKLMRPAIVTWDGDEVYIYRTDGKIKWEGSGSYDTGDSPYDKPQRMTSYPRVHTPSGVRSKGQGYGTALYTGLCLGAYLDENGIHKLDIPYGGEGISSEEETRSSSATAWWTKAKEKGLASEVEAEEEREDVELDVSSADLDECGIGPPESTISHVNVVNVDLVEHGVADVYEYDAAWGGDLAVAELSYEAYRGSEPEVERFWKQIAEGDVLGEVHDVNWEALCACDVSRANVDALNLLVALCRHAEADEVAVDAMRVRWELGIDPSQQKLFPFKMNAADAAVAKEALGLAKELRQGLAWKRFASLP